MVFVTVAALVFLAGLHVYWGVGGFWPGTSSETLADTIYGVRSAMPSPAACFVVAVLLGSAATLVASAGGVLPALPLAHLGATVVSAVFLLRGVGGFFDLKLRPRTRGSRFAKLNLRFYSPLCLLLSAATYLSTRA